MKNTTIRISGELLQNLKLLKAEHMAVTYEDLLMKVVRKELEKCFALTQDGYLAVGTVVKDGDEVLVIDSIDRGEVRFSDGSFALNGGRAVRKLTHLADSLQEYEGGRNHD
jgi:hypothetical protein